MKMKRVICPRSCPSRLLYNSMPLVCQWLTAAQTVAQSKGIVIFVLSEQLFARPRALAAESGAASVSHGFSEWALVWGLASHSQLPWRLGSMLEWKLPLLLLLL